MLHALLSPSSGVAARGSSRRARAARARTCRPARERGDSSPWVARSPLLLRRACAAAESLDRAVKARIADEASMRGRKPHPVGSVVLATDGRPMSPITLVAATNTNRSRNPIRSSASPKDETTPPRPNACRAQPQRGCRRSRRSAPAHETPAPVPYGTLSLRSSLDQGAWRTCCARSRGGQQPADVGDEHPSARFTEGGRGSARRPSPPAARRAPGSRQRSDQASA